MIQRRIKEMFIMRKALLSTLLLLIPAAALAQSHRFEVTPVAGIRFDGEFRIDDDFLDERDVRVDQGADSGHVPGHGLLPADAQVTARRGRKPER